VADSPAADLPVVCCLPVDGHWPVDDSPVHDLPADDLPGDERSDSKAGSADG
jgi:hypothetical protein